MDYFVIYLTKHVGYVSLFYSTFTLLLWLFSLACKQISTFHTLGFLVAQKEESKPSHARQVLYLCTVNGQSMQLKTNTTNHTKTLPILCIFTA